jgi:hypothetical protein
MKRYLFMIALFVVIVFISCNDKKDNVSPEPKIKAPIIYGYNLIDINGAFMKKIGNPNTKNTGTINPNNFFAFYPNPVKYDFAIYAKADNPEEPKKIWMKPARLDNDMDDSELGFNIENNVTEDEIVFEHEFTSENTAFNISSKPKGYYRVYLKIGQDTLYDNLVLIH